MRAGSIGTREESDKILHGFHWLECGSGDVVGRSQIDRILIQMFVRAGLDWEVGGSDTSTRCIPGMLVNLPFVLAGSIGRSEDLIRLFAVVIGGCVGQVMVVVGFPIQIFCACGTRLGGRRI